MKVLTFSIAILMLLEVNSSKEILLSLSISILTLGLYKIKKVFLKVSQMKICGKVIPRIYMYILSPDTLQIFVYIVSVLSITLLLEVK